MKKEILPQYVYRSEVGFNTNQYIRKTLILSVFVLF